MSRRLRAALIFICFIFIVPMCFSQAKLPNTLLWRISGNGLSKPSYLFGTMHLQDKRLFNFGDSVYQAIEKVDGLALEVDFKEFLDSIFVQIFQNAEKKNLEDDEVKIEHNKLDKSADSVLQEFGFKSDKISRKDLKRIRDHRLNSLVQGDMQTIVDGYLYGIALRNGKWIGGIEDVTDQMNLIDELGGDLTADKVLLPESDLRKGVEEMIDMYVRQDLGDLMRYVDRYSGSEWKYQVLTHRNIKMARRMDSLAAIRTMFFAVGAAHLPGDSGVISLLRSRGFAVDPVFSSQKIPVETYGKLKPVQWSKVEDNEKLFSIEMPGVASDYNMMGQAFKMKMFFDLTTMTFYMAGRTMGRFNTDVEADKMIMTMAEKMGAAKKEIKKKSIKKGEVFGMEGSFEAPSGYFTVQVMQKKNTLFMLMAGSSKKTNLDSDDLGHFFNSFTPNDVAENKIWKKFTFPGKAAYVIVPGEPKPNSAIDKVAEGTPWKFYTYDHLDLQKGLYYLMQVRDIREGYYLDNDTSYFSLYQKDLSKKLNKILRSEKGLYKGFPSFHFEGISEAENTLFKTFHVIRGNRIHTLIVGGQQNADFSDAETFFNSLDFENYPAPEITTHNIDGFSTTAAAPIKKIIKAEDDNSIQRLHYISYNPTDVISYEIFKEPRGSLYWSTSDSAFFAAHENASISAGDSLLKKEMKYNGSLRSMDLIIQPAHSNNLKKIRFFINGDTVYMLLAFIPTQYINSDYHLKFFDDFRVSKEIAPTIYNDKSAELLEALKTKDSLEFQKAYTILNRVSFDKNSLPYLHKGLFEMYGDRDESYGVHSKIVDEVLKLADSTTIPFIRDHFKELTGEKEELKYVLLTMLARFKSAEAYSLIKELLLKQLPAKGNEISFAWALRDSMELTRTLFPEILTLHKDSIFREALVTVTNYLLDSNIIAMKDVLPYRKAFLDGAKSNWKQLKDSADVAWNADKWIGLIGKFNDKESNLLLQEYLKLEPIASKNSAILALAINRQLIDSKEIEKVAADKSYRLALYGNLKKINSQNLFPAKYANQKSFAESQLFEIASDDMDVSQMNFVGERIATLDGKKRKFYLFKITSQGEDDLQNYLGIAGPYDLNTKELVAYAGHTALNWQDAYDKSKIEDYFREFLKNIEKQLKETGPDSPGK